MTYQESVLTPFTLHKRFYTANNHALAPRQTLSQKKEEKDVVDFISKEIKKLGYKVNCTTVVALEGDSPEDCIESYLISTIYNSDGIMVYGDERCQHDGVERPGLLAQSHRTIFHKSLETCRSYLETDWLNYYNTLTSWLDTNCGLYTELDKKLIRKGIVHGGLAIKNAHIWDNGISTIGNTLPNDIVQLLEDINKNHDEYDLSRVIDLEFEIPSFMMDYFTDPNFGKVSQ